MDSEASSSHDSPSNSTCVTSGALQSLSNLPSRGLCPSVVVNPGTLRVYTCDHDTAPPEGQVITTNSRNILIRSLVKKPKSEPSSKDVKEAGTRKRGAEKALDGRPKRSVKDGSSNSSPVVNFTGYTVERLKVLLKEKGLSLKGKKDELIARLKNG